MLPFVSCFLIILAVIYFYFNGKASKYALLLPLYFIVLSLYPISYYFTFFTKNDFALAIFFNNFSGVYFLAGPLLFFYVKATIHDGIKWKFLDILHFIPFLILTINAIPYLFTSFEYKLEVARHIHQNNGDIAKLQYSWFIPKYSSLRLRPLFVTFYTIASACEIYKYNLNLKQKTKQTAIVTRWLILLLISSQLFMIVYFMVSYFAIKDDIQYTFNIVQRYLGFLGGLYLIIPTSILIFPQILYGIPKIESNEVVKGRKDSKSTESSIKSNQRKNDTFKDLSNRIIEYIEDQKPYTSPKFNLGSLSIALKVPQHHISYCFSDFLDTSFTELRSRKRVEHAKELLMSGLSKQYTMEKIAELSGFSSRATFFSTFKQYTGMTATEFLKILQK